MMKRSFFAVSVVFLFATHLLGQSYLEDMARDSARSDKLTGGRIEKSSLVPGDGDIKITVNVPAFQMTFWQSGKEIKTYPVGVGMRDFPIFIGQLRATAIEWNPIWVPPFSSWVTKSSAVRPGQVILPTDSRNPLGKVKLPLGYSYLIHQAKGPGDMGSLVSHGCVRVMLRDLYDLSDKIVAARRLPVSSKRIASAKSSKRMLSVPLKPPLSVEITYDTFVVESGRLHIYPDVYRRGKNTPENLREELRSSGVNTKQLTDAQIKKMLDSATNRKQFVVETKDIEAGDALTKGQIVSVGQSAPSPPTKKGH